MVQNEKTDWLFDFIKSLTQNEKRYFKVHSAPQGTDSKKYFQLFDAYDNLSSWDSGKLKKKIKDPKLLKFLPQEKRNLYSILLKTLRAFHSDSSVNHKTTSHLEDYEILMRKNLFVLAGKSLEKAKTQAEEYENFSDLIKIYSLEIEHVRPDYRSSSSKEKTALIFKKIEEVVGKLINYMEYEKAYAHVVRMNKKIELVSSLNEVYELNKILANPIFSGEIRALSIRAKILYNYIFGVYHYFINEYSKSEEYFSRYLKLFEDNPKIRELQADNYIRALKNYLFIKLKLGKIKEFLEMFPKLAGLKTTGIAAEDDVYYSSYMFTVMYLVQTGHYMAAVSFSEAEKTRFEEVSKRIESQHVLFEESVFVRFRTSFANLCIGNTDEAIRQIEYYMNTPGSEKKHDSYTISHVVLCILHYESGNRKRLWEYMDLTLNLLDQKSRLNEFERIAQRFFRKAKDSGIKNKWKKEFELLIKELEPIKYKKFEQNVFEYFNYNAWLESKLSGKTLAQIHKNGTNGFGTEILNLFLPPQKTKDEIQALQGDN